LALDDVSVVTSDWSLFDLALDFSADLAFGNTRDIDGRLTLGRLTFGKLTSGMLTSAISDRCCVQYRTPSNATARPATVSSEYRAFVRCSLRCAARFAARN